MLYLSLLLGDEDRLFVLTESEAENEPYCPFKISIKSLDLSFERVENECVSMTWAQDQVRYVCTIV